MVVDVGGVGLALQCTPSTAAALRIGDEAQLPASLVVREESLTLYGFADEDERQIFELLQTASGIGPRLAQAMLAVHTPDDLRRAVATEDLVALTRVPGSARRGPNGSSSSSPTSSARRSVTSAPQPRPDLATDGWQGQVHAALLGLGWSGREADAAVDEVTPLVGDGVDAADVPHCSRRRCGPWRGRERPRPASRRGHRAGAAVGDSEADGDERAIEAALRPRTLAEFIGQERLREQVSLDARGGPGPRPAWPTTCCCRSRPAWARPRWR